MCLRMQVVLQLAEAAVVALRDRFAARLRVPATGVFPGYSAVRQRVVADRSVAAVPNAVLRQS